MQRLRSQRFSQSCAPWCYDSSVPGSSIATDVRGSMTATPEGFKYAVTFLELHTRVAIVFLMRSRKETVRLMLKTTAKISLHF